MYWILYTYLIVLISSGSALSPQPGVLHFEFVRDGGSVGFPRALYKNSEIYAQIGCRGDNGKTITAQVNLTKLSCFPEFIEIGLPLQVQLSEYSDGNPQSVERKCTCPCHLFDTGPELAESSSIVSSVQHSIIVDANKMTSSIQAINPTVSKETGEKHDIFTIRDDGVYFLTVKVNIVNDNNESSYTNNITLDINMKGPRGYLSAIDLPLLTFYGVMCLVYIVLGIGWLVVSFMQWRDLLRIQFWICAVILLGMLEKAMFFAEYDAINNVGENLMPGIVLLAEWISCAKRTLARMLVIIASLGFGIVKPRLGSHLHRIICIGTIYFLSAAWEAYSRVTNTEEDHITSLLIATVVLAILDSFVSWWIFSNLVQTMRTLRLRRNLVKLSLYNKFTNTLICAVVLSVIFMLYSIKTRKIHYCIPNWKVIWIDDAFWHLLFSIILLVIMILWRPTNNNQRYAFSPLLDAPDDEDDDEDIEHFISDAYGVKMRGYNNCRSESPKHKNTTTSAEDDLKWVEENIPSTLISTTLPIIDSDEEIMNTKFEISKME